MKVKAVIMRPDRTNDVVVVKKKNIEGKTFRHDKVTYFLHPDRFQVTWIRRAWFFKSYYSTYYYTKGVTNPLPVPDFQMVEDPLVTLAMADGKTVMARFPKVLNQGVEGEELAAIFNPWFYRTIAQQKDDWWKELSFWINLGTLLGIVILLWQAFNGDPSTAAPVPTPADT